MKQVNVFVFFAIAMLALASGVFAATSSSTSSSSSSSTSNAVLQVTDYSTIPASVYPDSTGYVKLTLSNSGTDTATGITVYYSHSQSTGQMSFTAGDISSGSSTQITVPFKIPSSVPTGIYNVNVDIYYSSSTSGQARKTSMSVPIQVSQYQALEVSTVSTDKQSMAPGESVSVDLVVRNKGGIINNLVISTPDNSSFTLQGTTAQSLGSLDSNTSANATVILLSSSSTSVGQYTIPLVFTYQDVLGNTNTQTLYVGPVNVLESSTQFKLGMEPETATEIGSQAKFLITLENTGTSPITAVADLNSTTAFTPIGSSRLYFDSVGAGKKLSQEIVIGVSNSVSAGYYILPVKVTLGAGSSSTQYIGIVVTATPELVISADTSSAALYPGATGSKVTVQVSNTGNSAIRSVYASASGGDFQLSGTADKFIGTLNVDDYATLSLTVSVPRTLSAGMHSLPVSVSFKDTNNELHVVNKSVEIEVASGSAALVSGSTTGTTRTRGYTIFGIDALYIGIAIVALAGGYFGYRHWKGKEKKKKEAAMKAKEGSSRQHDSKGGA